MAFSMNFSTRVNLVAIPLGKRVGNILVNLGVTVEKRDRINLPILCLSCTLHAPLDLFVIVEISPSHIEEVLRDSHKIVILENDVELLDVTDPLKGARFTSFLEDFRDRGRCETVVEDWLRIKLHLFLKEVPDRYLI